MPVYTINPLADARWKDFCQRHPRSSVFHTAGWLEALRRTYGYEPIAYTTSSPTQELKNAVVFCRIESWLTGRRLVSLPFADHCEPLVDEDRDREEIFAALRRALKQDRFKYVEVRPIDPGFFAATPLEQGEPFYLHRLGLGPALEDIFRNLQKDSIQRKIRRAERDGVAYEEGRSELLLRNFYGLLLLTRRRHRLPPQPLAWFRNLIACLRDRLTIRLASHEGRPVAGILTLQHRDTLVYKYGGSDAGYHNLGGMPFLMWKAIEAGKQTGLQMLDFGRSDRNNEGLIRFKDQLGTTRSLLAYGRISATPVPQKAGEGFWAGFAQRLFGYMPDFMFTAAGRLLYRHMA